MASAQTAMITEHIFTNDPTLKDIHLDRCFSEQLSSGGGEAVVVALRGNHVIERVHLGSDFILPTGQLDDDVLTAIGRIPSLEQLHVHRVQLPLCVRHLATIVHHARRLTVLDVRHADLLGDEGGFAELEASLKQHPSLETFVLKDIAVVGAGQFCFDRIVQVLGTIPSLARVELEARKAGHGTLNGFALTGLLTASEKLEHLHISRFHLDQLSVNRIAHGVKHMRNFKSLSLPHAGLDDLGVIKLATALKRRIIGGSCCRGGSSGNDRDFRLHRLDLSFNEFGDKGCIALAEAIMVHSGIEVLGLNGNKKIGSAGWKAMTVMLDNQEKKTTERLQKDDGVAGGGVAHSAKYEYEYKESHPQPSLQQLLCRGLAAN